MVMKQFKLNSLSLLLSRFFLNKGSNYYFTDCVKYLTLACIQMFMNGFDSNLV